MRFERHGGPPDLQQLFKTFVLASLKGRALDDNHLKEASEGRFPDFSCFNDLLLIEMKHLETDQNDRINEVLDEKIVPEEKPLFYGSRDASLVTDKLSNSAEINAAVFSKLSRTIETILRKANKQFEGYRSRHPRKNTVNICTLLNAKLQEYTPEVVVKAVHSKMKSEQVGEPRFPHIDAVIYISEKHFKALPDGRIAHCIASYEGMGSINNPWKIQFIESIINAWSMFRTGDPLHSDNSDNDVYGFSTVKDIPRRMKKYEVWQLEYQRNPYLNVLTLEQLRVHFHRTMAVNSLAFVKGSWPKPTKENIENGLRQCQHVIEETNLRGVDMRDFHLSLLTPDEMKQVFSGLPLELVSILTRGVSKGLG